MEKIQMMFVSCLHLPMLFAGSKGPEREEGKKKKQRPININILSLISRNKENKYNSGLLL
jgi:hypothetical protein